MPMRHAWRTPNNVARRDPPWPLTLVADPSLALDNSEKLAPFMPVPIGAGKFFPSTGKLARQPHKHS